MALSEDVRNRLYNFKFTQAKDRLTEEEKQTPEGQVVEQLAARYENPGWFGGSEGYFIWAVLALLGVEDE